ncbi:hypothetical protein AKJ51_00490 [candidate division MSBL1 archaeon SCGC-AAA382A20]|uniref:Uncharacterized protein n=1 Tax=candidate division MSBL1 archaeon SCGC-AAA382A20 TaxID=1698280 RepID=A0A133VMK0_9EURY|nr:hypothetical protein AKJ51_00490 [candidate division MSBL1 archaeon SCGC-AAA382A20]
MNQSCPLAFFLIDGFKNRRNLFQKDIRASFLLGILKTGERAPKNYIPLFFRKYLKLINLRGKFEFFTSSSIKKVTNLML